MTLHLEMAFFFNIAFIASFLNVVWMIKSNDGFYYILNYKSSSYGNY